MRHGLVDSHCHLDYLERQGDLAGVLSRARGAGVGTML
ncbi:MAG: LuxR family transcriptional regulator, partial [Alphaproteobacteria bacterium]|nr:LuxR family transcriptional regulator [Alphaproteobacteria bacterium]